MVGSPPLAFVDLKISSRRFTTPSFLTHSMCRWVCRLAILTGPLLRTDRSQRLNVRPTCRVLSTVLLPVWRSFSRILLAIVRTDKLCLTRFTRELVRNITGGIR